jgi:transposase
MENGDRPTILIGRKAICSHLGLTWQTVLKWKKRWKLPICQENGRPPSLSLTELAAWHKKRNK